MVSRLKLLAQPEPSVRACLLLPRGLHFNFVKITFVCNYLSTFVYPGLLRLKQQLSKELKIMCLLCCILPNFLGSTAWPYMPRRPRAFTFLQEQGQSGELLSQSPVLPAAYPHHNLQYWHKTQTPSSNLCHTLSSSSCLWHKPQVAKTPQWDISHRRISNHKTGMEGCVPILHTLADKND